MHTQMTTGQFVLWASIIVLQLGTGFFCKRYVKAYLFAEGIGSGTLLCIARLASWQVYLEAYRVAQFVHEAISLYLLVGFICAIRERGLPRRQGTLIIQIAFALCFSLGIRSAHVTMSMISNPTWRILFSWDHAFQFALCCLVAFLPLYTMYVSATLQRPFLLTIIPFGLYSAIDAGALDYLIKTHYSQALNVSYGAHIVMLACWLIASQLEGRRQGLQNGPT